MNTVSILKGIKKADMEKLYQDKYIRNAFKQDGRLFEPSAHPLISYYSIFINGEFNGACMYVQFSKYEVELHSMLFKKAIPYSRKLGKEVIDIAFSDKDVLRITAPILSDLKKAMNFVEKLGFKLEGIKKNVTMRNNKPLDTYIYGLIKD